MQKKQRDHSKNQHSQKLVILEDKQTKISQTHQEKKNNQINKIRNENGEITTENKEIQRIIRDYYQQLCDNKMDNLEEMD